MAPTNFDKQFKDALEQRRITPSADAWKKLEAQLETSSEGEQKKSFWWLAVAASITAIAFVVYLNFKTDPATIKNDVQQVEVNEIPAPEKNNETINDQPNQLIEATQTEEAVAEVPSSKKVTPPVVKANQIVEPEIQQEILTDKVAEVEKEVLMAENNDQQTLEQQKINAIVTEMKALDSTDHWSVDNEVDALLAEAQRKIKLEKLYQEALQNIDAQALLDDVEEDLEESFRSKVFEALKASYKEVKSAVAGRNN